LSRAWQHPDVCEAPGDDVDEDLLARVFPGQNDDEDGSGSVPGVDERRQRLLEPLGDPDREPW